MKEGGALRIDDPIQNILDLFSHPGWSVLMEEMKEAEEALVAGAWTCKDMEQLCETKGRIRQLRYLLNYESVMRNSTHDVV